MEYERAEPSRQPVAQPQLLLLLLKWRRSSSSSSGNNGSSRSIRLFCFGFWAYSIEPSPISNFCTTECDSLVFWQLAPAPTDLPIIFNLAVPSPRVLMLRLF